MNRGGGGSKNSGCGLILLALMAVPVVVAWVTR
jgi:hypothetical protein